MTKTERLLIDGPAGKLAALLEWEPKVKPRLAAVVCHPHPLYGGTMHNKVVFRAAKAAIQQGVPTLRFNFRGAGKSTGRFDGGVGERDDVRAALDYLHTRFPSTPLCVVGFSFGAWVGLAVGAKDPRVSALVGLGVPTTYHDLGFLQEVTKPKLIIQGTQDEFGPRAQIEELFRLMPQPKRLRWVQGADHFLTGKLDEIQQAVGEYLREITPASP